MEVRVGVKGWVKALVAAPYVAGVLLSVSTQEADAREERRLKDPDTPIVELKELGIIGQAGLNGMAGTDDRTESPAALKEPIGTDGRKEPCQPPKDTEDDLARRHAEYWDGVFVSLNIALVIIISLLVWFMFKIGFFSPFDSPWKLMQHWFPFLSLTGKKARSAKESLPAKKAP